MKTKKLLNVNNPENTIVHVVLHPKNDKKNYEYESVCVLHKETANNVNLVFNAKNNVAFDSVNISNDEIISIDILTKPIKELR